MNHHPSSQRSSSPSPTRRQVLGGLTLGSGLAATGWARGRAPFATPGPALWDLKAHSTAYSFGNGTQLPYLRFAPLAGGALRGSVPFFEADEGAWVGVRITNELQLPIRPEVVGVITGPEIQPGATREFNFSMPSAGSHLLRASRTGSSGGIRPLRPGRGANGLAGFLVSRPVGNPNQLWSGGPTFESEYVLLYEDADERRTRATGSSSELVRQPYVPDYFTVNGLAFPDLPADPDSRIVGSLGERILIRMGNLGRMRQAIHFHGYHVEILARNNVPETVLPPKDTFPLPVRETVDVLLTPQQIGVFPLHPHSLTTTTAGGLYPFGQITLIEIT